VALMPVLLTIVFCLPGIFMAPIVDRMPRLFPFVMICGFSQCFPCLLAALGIVVSRQQRILLPHSLDCRFCHVFSGLAGGVSTTVDCMAGNGQAHGAEKASCRRLGHPQYYPRPDQDTPASD